MNIEELARLLAVLPPAPAGWVEAAQELPRLRAGLDVLVARAEQDAELRARLVSDLEAALAESGIAPLRASSPRRGAGSAPEPSLNVRRGGAHRRRRPRGARLDEHPAAAGSAAALTGAVAAAIVCKAARAAARPASAAQAIALQGRLLRLAQADAASLVPRARRSRPPCSRGGRAAGLRARAGTAQGSPRCRSAIARDLRRCGAARRGRARGGPARLRRRRRSGRDPRGGRRTGRGLARRGQSARGRRTRTTCARHGAQPRLRRRLSRGSPSPSMPR